MLAKHILRWNPVTRLKVMCLGYGEDFDCLTELVREDDCDLDFQDAASYPRFELWWD